MWLAPYLPYKDHQIKILFKETVTIAMIRLWVHTHTQYLLIQVHVVSLLSELQQVKDSLLQRCEGY